MAAVEAHESAIIEPGADVGVGSRIWHHAHVRAGAVVGRNCSLGKNVFVDAGAVIGDCCKIQNNVSIFNGVTLEDEVFVGPSAVFTNDVHPRAHSTVGWTLVTTHVGRGSSIGANATVLAGVTIAPWSMVGAGSVLTRSTDRHELVVGNPARRAGWSCVCGDVVSKDASVPAGLECQTCGHVLTTGDA